MKLALSRYKMINDIDAIRISMELVPIYCVKCTLNSLVKLDLIRHVVKENEQSTLMNWIPGADFILVCPKHWPFTCPV